MVHITPRLIAFQVLFWGFQLGIFVFGWFKQKNDPELSFLNQIGTSVFSSRGAGLIIGVNCAALLLGVCRNVVRVMRQTFLNRWIPFEENLYFHRWFAYAMLFFSLIHTNAHYTNFFLVEYMPVIRNALGLKAWQVHYLAWGGVTGHIMLGICFLMFTSAKMEVKKKNFEIFWYTHHLFIPFYFCLFFHAFGCFVKSTQTKQCKGYNSNYGTVPIFCLYIAERLLREYRAREPTKLTKVIFHPGNTMELRIEKPSFLYKPGQYLFLNIPSVSRFQWHPFTISSCPEEGFVSLHIRILGDWTKNAAQILGCFQGGITKTNMGSVPTVYIDGPYGAPAEDLYNYETALLIGAGIGVTPAASLLKSVWYRYYRKAPMPLKKLYFFWINRDTQSFSWFQSLLSSLEETVPTNMLEIHTYVTGKQSIEDIHNIAMNINAEFDPITELQTRTHYGRPDWARVFQSIRATNNLSAGSEVGVFFCGPSPMAHAIGKECNSNSDGQVKFVLRKEHF
ncbi:ferric reductase NAD binding domain-containing protein [Gorgonomyces haynaldii]|nr:ferric reductase NAD binding domain-containing protein [Gorgonomyces haynaldii]